MHAEHAKRTTIRGGFYSARYNWKTLFEIRYPVSFSFGEG